MVLDIQYKTISRSIRQGKLSQIVISWPAEQNMLPAAADFRTKV